MCGRSQGSRVWVVFISQLAVVDCHATGHMSRDSATLLPLRSPPLCAGWVSLCWLRFLLPLARHHPSPLGSLCELPSTGGSVAGQLILAAFSSSQAWSMFRPGHLSGSLGCTSTGDPPPPSFHPGMKLLFEDPPYPGVFPQGPLRALPQTLVIGEIVGSLAAAPRCGFP